ncbi:MAG: helix-turn-helix domain-containing protein [Planctomycetales bacterium]|nr:helix-turn-helix domain-containing protein [Planctomycetales bacterium]
MGTDATGFAEALVAARRAAGLSQAESARRAGVTPAYLSMVERGLRPPPSDEAVARLADAVGASRVEMLSLAHLTRAPADLRDRMARLNARLSRQRAMWRGYDEEILPFTIWSLFRVRPGTPRLARGRKLPAGLAGILGRILDRARALASFGRFRRETAQILGSLPSRERREVLRELPKLVASATRRLP